MNKLVVFIAPLQVHHFRLLLAMLLHSLNEDPLLFLLRNWTSCT